MAGEVSKLTTIERGCGDIRCEPPRLSLKDLFIISERSIMGAKITASAVCGGIAGVSAKIAVYPLDVLKKRAQIRGSETVRRHFGKVCRSVPERILEAILVNLLQFSEKRNYFFLSQIEPWISVITGFWPSALPAGVWRPARVHSLYF